MAHGDYDSTQKKLLSKYPLTKVYGVSSFLEDIHHLREQRFRGTDTTFLSGLLIDFEKIQGKAGLTERQLQALWYRFELDLFQTDVAEIMGISQQAVSKHIDNAIAKIVIVAKEEEIKYEDAF